jgi:hypothetical protein
MGWCLWLHIYVDKHTSMDVHICIYQSTIVAILLWLYIIIIIVHTLNHPYTNRLSGVTKMGLQEFNKWDDVSGNTEKWLEHSYYSFAKGTYTFVCKHMWFNSIFICYKRYIDVYINVRLTGNTE